MKVAVPTNVDRQEEELENSYRMYAVSTALWNGKMPTNRQITGFMNRLLQFSKDKTTDEELSADGKDFFRTFQQVITIWNRIITKKNNGELLQNALNEFSESSIDASKEGGIDVPGRDELTELGHDAKDLFFLFVNNGRFRKLAKELVGLLGHKGAGLAEDKYNKFDEQRGAYDGSKSQADGDESDEDTPDLSLDQSDDDESASSESDGSPQYMSGGRSGREIIDDSVYDNMEETTTIEHPADHDLFIRTVISESQTTQPKKSVAFQPQPEDEGKSKQKQQTKQQSRSDQGGNQKDKSDKKSSQEKKPRRAERVMDSFLGDKKEDVLEDLRRVVTEVQSQPKYQKAASSILRMIEHYTKSLNQSTEDLEIHPNSHSKRAVKNLRALVEQTLNHKMDGIVSTIKQLNRDAKKDKELSQLFRRAYKFARKCVLQKGYIVSKDSNRAYDKLQKDYERMLKEKYKTHWDRFHSELNDVMDAASNDADMNELSSKGKKLYSMLIKHEGGQASVRTGLLLEVTRASLPNLLETIQYFPIPRVEIQEEKFDVVLENLNLQTLNILPKIAEFRTDSMLRFSMRDLGTATRRNVFFFHLSNVQCDFKNVNYYVKRKRGFPSFADVGIIDLIMGNQGMVVDLAITVLDTKEMEETGHLFSVDTVQTTLHSLKLKVHKSRHKILLSLLKPSLMMYMKHSIQRSTELQIRKMLEQVSVESYTVHQNAKAEMKKEAKKPKKDQQSRTRVYFQNVISRVSELRETRKKKSHPSPLRLVMNEKGSRLSEIELPSRNLQRTEFYRQQALSGEGWRSSIFDSLSGDTSSLEAGQPTPANERLYQRTKKQTKRHRRDSYDDYAAGGEMPQAGLQAASYPPVGSYTQREPLTPTDGILESYVLQRPTETTPSGMREEHRTVVASST
ncbi:fungal protein [Schizosaccharomyces japonicus yFS275]|uniref:Fungal protein n=1 Tax=Schizosaccharomyces japonicus (strain yFS275 / FY16936) TaxID=402676 RepID=B6K8C7_SCHJY|nr:fungal protein [Schizosaccharomyces japonicus yFS275]EEB09781.2 fungal protein [Schizosaccharomyces japonicus yFS275]